VAVDLLIGVVEIVILLVTATRTAVALPPAGAPASQYNHVVGLYSDVVIATVTSALLTYVLRRRWLASVLQALIVLAALATVLALNGNRVAGGLTGF
jgi:hypothetical protein